MTGIFQFSLQDYKQTSIDFLLLLNADSNLHPVCSFHNSHLLIPFVIDFECIDLERMEFRMKYCLVLNFIFCII